ncbi:Tfp pilus assembly protein FimT/FimU [Pseudoalteromonas distincta]|uniref:Tfp pilus assembly protein FimT/FimU n=1 Tax=Pseudoalteromonas distincta TaxID=77608 RepID=UPI0032E13F75
MKAKNTGFTLIELMIATAILSGLLFLGSFTYQMLAQRWTKELGEFQNTLETTKSFNLLNATLTAVQPYVVLDEDDGNSTSYNPGFLFIGRENRLFSVTKQGLFDQNYPEIFRLIVEKNAENKYNLIYQGVSTKQQALVTAQQNITFTQQITLLSDFDEIKFNYLGWDGFVARSEGIQNGLQPTWRKTFSGLDNQLLPDQMAILLKKDDKDLLFTVAFDAKSLRYLTPYLSNND